MKYFKVEISAENQEQAESILQPLLEKKLVTGGQFLKADARFLWKGQIHDMREYVTVTSFTLESLKDQIIEEVERVSVEEVPMIVFLPLEGNEKLESWISATLS